MRSPSEIQDSETPNISNVAAPSQPGFIERWGKRAIYVFVIIALVVIFLSVRGCYLAGKRMFDKSDQVIEKEVLNVVPETAISVTWQAGHRIGGFIDGVPFVSSVGKFVDGWLCSSVGSGRIAFTREGETRTARITFVDPAVVWEAAHPRIVENLNDSKNRKRGSGTPILSRLLGSK